MKNNIYVWQTDSLYKVLRKNDYQKTSVGELNLKLYQNETEGVTFYLTPDIDLDSLNIEVNTAYSVDGKGDALSVQIGFVLYVPVEKSSVGTKSELGLYPDAILPFEVAKKFGKTSLKAKENQEIILSVKTNANTPNGVYRTSVKITADEKVVEIPLTVTVWDYALPTENHTRQYFIIDSKHLQLVEGGGLEKYKRYYDDLLEYRINGSRMPFNSEADYKTVAETFIEQLRIYYSDSRITVINLPVFYTEQYDDVDYPKTEYVYDKIIEASVEDGVDYFKKAVTYLWILDEPHLSPVRTGYCKKVLPEFEKFKKKKLEQCLLMQKENALYAEIGSSIMAVPNVITSGVNTEILTDNPLDSTITWCPLFPAHEEMVLMWKKMNEGEKWWYGCDWPVPPYATYHIDDKILSPRLLSWMQYDYRVTGNLYWRINYWARKDGEELVYVNPYEQSPFEKTHGEGMLLYPGSQFGLQSFVPCTRLNAVRDGIEDFEAIYSLEKEMKQVAEKEGKQPIDVNRLLSPIYTRLFHKTTLIEKLHIPFEEARENVAEYLIAAKRNGFAVLSKDENERKMTFLADGEIKNTLGGKTVKTDGVYEVYFKDDEVVLNFEDGSKVTLYLKDYPHPKKLATTDNWRATAEKYQIETDAEDILKPYYEPFFDKNVKNLIPHCKTLGSFISFIWRTEAVVTKSGDKVKTVKVYLPKGKLTSEEAHREERLDEDGKVYTFETDKKSIELEVTNAKGSYSVVLII